VAILVLVAVWPGLAVSGSGRRITWLATVYVSDPLGIDVARSRLSWMLDSSQRVQVQTGYQVLGTSDVGGFRLGCVE
jgi:hypothetical protein